MITTKERYLVDETGKRVAVVLELEKYKKIMEELEELASLKAYDNAVSSPGESIPFNQAMSEIEKNRK